MVSCKDAAIKFVALDQKKKRRIMNLSVNQDTWASVWDRRNKGYVIILQQFGITQRSFPLEVKILTSNFVLSFTKFSLLSSN